MHLVFAIDSLHSGGAQRQAVELAVELVRQSDLRIRFLLYRSEDFHADRLRRARIPFDVIPKRWRVDPRHPGRLRRWLRERRADVVHAFLPWPSLWCYLGVRGMRPDERPAFIAAERSSLIATRPAEALVQRILYRGADAVTTNAESVAEEIHCKLGVPRDRIHYLPNGIDLADWDLAAERPAPFELEAGAFHLGLVGGLRAEKNHVLVLEALHTLGEERTRGWRLWFVGDETGERGYAQRVRDAVRRLGLGARVRIEPPTRDIAAFVRRLDGVLLPSDFEGFPNVALEAMASRVPVVATPVGDVPNLIRDGETGLLLPGLTVTAVSEALLRLHALGRDGRAALGGRARRRVEERYAMPSVARRYLDLYRAVAERRAGAA